MATPLSTEPAAVWYGTFTDRSGTVATGGTSQVLAAYNPSRKVLVIQNPSAQTESLFINFSSSASTSDGKSIELAPGEHFIMDAFGFLTWEAVNVTAATSSHPFMAKEA